MPPQCLLFVDCFVKLPSLEEAVICVSSQEPLEATLVEAPGREGSCFLVGGGLSALKLFAAEWSVRSPPPQHTRWCVSRLDYISR